MQHAEETSIDENKVQDDDESYEEKSVKKEMVAPVSGKKVERLISVIKASIAPLFTRRQSKLMRINVRRY
uniref:Uncharacterized protein n=1 Tax=Tanacetum cinerariifolium TaxID=118510 RepID=A0A699HED7_TANCI|nr:hypothetical protein [Tanacetum cinerariifolium]